jgi:shikimate dehydrogenase
MNRVGVIGWPVSHSISPAMHNAAFAAMGLTEWSYELLPIPPDIIKQGLRELRDHGFTGVNVTVPHKQAVMPFVKPDERARAVGAVNTIDFRDNRGTNTDIAGFIDDLKANAVTLANANVLVLGAGGAARAAVYGLAHEGANIGVINRTTEKAQQMIDDLGVDARVMTFDDTDDWYVDLIVNCTLVGMWPNVDDCPWPEEVSFPEGVTVYDMVYRPETTRLMDKAEAHGGRAIGGLGMLVRQGAAAFQIWTGVKAPVEVMFEAAREGLRQANKFG